jgi:hypothetical protein
MNYTIIYSASVFPTYNPNTNGFLYLRLCPTVKHAFETLLASQSLGLGYSSKLLVAIVVLYHMTIHVGFLFEYFHALPAYVGSARLTIIWVHPRSSGLVRDK